MQQDFKHMDLMVTNKLYKFIKLHLCLPILPTSSHLWQIAWCV